MPDSDHDLIVQAIAIAENNPTTLRQIAAMCRYFADDGFPDDTTASGLRIKERMRRLARELEQHAEP